MIGNGRPAGCTSAAVGAAVAQGGPISFDCGPGAVTIDMAQTAKVMNTSPSVVLNGGGKVTLSGQGAQRILYMNTCDRKQVWTTSHCQRQSTPKLVIENMTFQDGDSSGDGQTGGGAAVRAYVMAAPVTVTGSTFSDNVCSNGGALGSIGASWTIQHSTFKGNRAIGSGANPPAKGTAGGGSGGAIYNDGDQMHLSLVDSTLTNNTANEGGGAIFFVSDDRTGALSFTGSRLVGNPSDGFETAGLPGIYFVGAHAPTIRQSVLKP